MTGLHRLYPFSSHFLEINGLSYHYLDEGRGDPVVMVHGNPTWSFYFRNLVQGLSRITGSSFPTIWAADCRINRVKINMTSGCPAGFTILNFCWIDLG